MAAGLNAWGAANVCSSNGRTGWLIANGASVRVTHAGVLWIQQVMSQAQAEEAVRAGADAIIAQGGEAGGNGGWVATMVLVPQVVDVADGRGLAAALAPGAQGVSMGTRFPASTEMRVADAWKERIVAADALDAVKVANSERIMPPFNRPGGPAEPRALRTPLIDQLRVDPESVDPERVGADLRAALLRGQGEDYLPLTGQSAGLV